MKITFNFDIESTDKTRSVVNNVGRALVKKKVPVLRSKHTDTINNSDMHDTHIYTHTHLYLSKKAREEKLFQGIQ